MEDYKTKVDAAYAAVKGIPQELQSKAFEILLKNARTDKTVLYL